MVTTSDPDDPRLTRGSDTEEVPQAEAYLVLPDEKRTDFVRPVRTRYQHVGRTGPRFPLRELTEEETERLKGSGYVKYEEYPLDSPSDGRGVVGRYWTQAQLDSVHKGCGGVTSMKLAIAETYARDPGFYGSTYCVHCQKHLPVGKDGEFIWEDGSRVGT